MEGMVEVGVRSKSSAILMMPAAYLVRNIPARITLKAWTRETIAVTAKKSAANSRRQRLPTTTGKGNYFSQS
jgi:hypothetical protein